MFFKYGWKRLTFVTLFHLASVDVVYTDESKRTKGKRKEWRVQRCSFLFNVCALG